MERSLECAGRDLPSIFGALFRYFAVLIVVVAVMVVLGAAMTAVGARVVTKARKQVNGTGTEAAAGVNGRADRTGMVLVGVGTALLVPSGWLIAWFLLSWWSGS